MIFPQLDASQFFDIFNKRQVYLKTTGKMIGCNRTVVKLMFQHLTNIAQCLPSILCIFFWSKLLFLLSLSVYFLQRNVIATASYNLIPGTLSIKLFTAVIFDTMSFGQKSIGRMSLSQHVMVM